MNAVKARRVVIVPGLAVRRYVLPAAGRLAGMGVEVDLRPAPGAPGQPADLEQYGVGLALRLGDAPPTPWSGFSVGSQGAAIAAACRPAGVRHLVLVSPTVPPQSRSSWRQLLRWAAAGRLESPRLLGQQLSEWARAGPASVIGGLASAQRVVLEDVLAEVTCPVTVVYGEDDEVSSPSYAAFLAAKHGARLIILPEATHSWPFRDPDRFAAVVEELLP